MSLEALNKIEKLLPRKPYRISFEPGWVTLFFKEGAESFRVGFASMNYVKELVEDAGYHFAFQDGDRDFFLN